MALPHTLSKVAMNAEEYRSSEVGGWGGGIGPKAGVGVDFNDLGRNRSKDIVLFLVQGEK